HLDIPVLTVRVGAHIIQVGERGKSEVVTLKHGLGPVPGPSAPAAELEKPDQDAGFIVDAAADRLSDPPFDTVAVHVEPKAMRVLPGADADDGGQFRSADRAPPLGGARLVR